MKVIGNLYGLRRVTGMVIGSNKYRPPSRLRYEQTHPTISLRVDLDTYEKLKGIQDRSGKSLAALIKECLGLREASTNEIYEKGYRDAEDRCKFSFSCSVCGEEIVISNNHPSVEVVKEKLKGIGHTECTSKKGQHQHFLIKKF